MNRNQVGEEKKIKYTIDPAEGEIVVIFSWGRGRRQWLRSIRVTSAQSRLEEGPRWTLTQIHAGTIELAVRREWAPARGVGEDGPQRALARRRGSGGGGRWRGKRRRRPLDAAIKELPANCSSHVSAEGSIQSLPLGERGRWRWGKWKGWWQTAHPQHSYTGAWCTCASKHDCSALPAACSPPRCFGCALARRRHPTPLCWSPPTYSARSSPPAAAPLCGKEKNKKRREERNEKKEKKKMRGSHIFSLLTYMWAP